MQPQPTRALQAGPFVPAEVATPAELALQPTTGLPQGYPVYVQSLGQQALLLTSSAALVTNQVIASQSPTMRWLVQPFPSGAANPWINQLSWGVNTTSGNDGAAGTPAAPLRSVDEFYRRLGGSLLNAAYNVAVVGAVPGGLNGAFTLGPAGTVAFDLAGGATVVAAGSVGAGGYVAAVPATPEYVVIQAAASLAGTANLRMRMTSGDAVGAVAFIGLVSPGGVGNTWARISPFQTFDMVTNWAGTPIPYGGGAGSINPGDTFVLETLAAIGATSLSATKQVNPLTGVAGTVGLLNCQIGAIGATQSVFTRGVQEAELKLFGCQIFPVNVYLDSALLWNCWLGFGGGGVGSFNVVGGSAGNPARLFQCLCTNTPILFDCSIQDSLCQSCNPDGLQPGGGGVFTIGQVGIFDSTRDAIRIEEFTQVNFADLARAYGNGNAVIGMHIMSPGVVAMCPNGTVPRINGTVNDYRIAANPVVVGAWGGGLPPLTNYGSGILDTVP